MANRRGRNTLVVQGAGNVLEKFKNEIAAEMGIKDYDKIDKGALPARVHGMIGGTITKRLIEMGQQALMGQDLSESHLNLSDYVKDMQQDLVNAQSSLAAVSTLPTPEQQATLH